MEPMTDEDALALLRGQNAERVRGLDPVADQEWDEMYREEVRYHEERIAARKLSETLDWRKFAF